MVLLALPHVMARHRRLLRQTEQMQMPAAQATTSSKTGSRQWKTAFMEMRVTTAVKLWTRAMTSGRTALPGMQARRMRMSAARVTRRQLQTGCCPQQTASQMTRLPMTLQHMMHRGSGTPRTWMQR